MMYSRARAILQSTAFFGMLSFLPKVFAIAKDAAVAARFGASQTLDVYLMALVLIGIPVSIIVIGIQTTLIPALVNKDEQTAAGLLGGAIKLTTVLLTLALPVWLLLLPVAIGALYPGNEGNVRHDLVTACLWLVPYYFMNGVNLLFYGALQARKIFWPNAVLPGLFPVAILLAVWLMPAVDIQSLLIGTVAGGVLEAGVLYFVTKRQKLLRLWRTAGSGLMPVVRLALPIMAGSVIASVAPMIEQLIAFRLGPGAVSLLSYGNKVPAALNSLLLTALGIVILPHFAELVTKQEWQSCKQLYLRVSCVAICVGIVVSGVTITFSETIVRTLFERGAFTAADTQRTASVMAVYLLQLAFMLFSIVSMRALIAMGKTLALSWILTAQMALAGCLAYMFSARFGVLGVAGGTVVATMAGALVFSVVAWRQLNQSGANAK